MSKVEKPMERFRMFSLDESGAATLEYGLLLAGLAVFLATAVGLFGLSVRGRFSLCNDNFP
jgi:Flp pilus assembly pilin Flp